jgi:hypothetical protein
MLLLTTKRPLWRYDNAFLFTNQSEVDFGIAIVYLHSGHSTENRAGFPKPYSTFTKLHCAKSKHNPHNIYFTHLESCKATLSYLSLVVKTSREEGITGSSRGNPDQKFWVLQKTNIIIT